MAIEIKETDHDTIVVNGKEVYKDANQNWIARQELTTQEQNAFNNYIADIPQFGNKSNYYQKEE